MASLTETAKLTKKLGLGFAIFLAGYTALTLGIGTLKSFWRSGHPAPPPGPETKFGKLPPLHLLEIPIPREKQPEFALETITGTFPDLPGLLKIYPLLLPQKSILAEDRAVALAANLGFRSRPRRLTNVDYLWENNDGTILKMNIITKNFELKTKRENVPLTAGQLPPKEALVAGAKKYFNSRGILGPTYADGSQTVTFLRYNGRGFKKAAGRSQAEVARVDFFRYLTVGEEKIPLLGPHPKKGISRLYAAGGQKIQYFSIHFTEWVFDLQNGSTYPLKGPEAAWEELKKDPGKAVYLSVVNESGEEIVAEAPELKKVTIRNVSLAYFDDEQAQNFLQPIYVFSGEAEILGGGRTNYIAYIPAIDPAWTIK